jgi:Immunoglobulin domain
MEIVFYVLTGKIKLKLTPKAVRTPLNKNVLLKCQVSGKPMPTISWVKNGQALPVTVNKNITSVKYVLAAFLQLYCSLQCWFVV